MTVPEVLPASNGPQALHQAGTIQDLKWHQLFVLFW